MWLKLKRIIGKQFNKRFKAKSAEIPKIIGYVNHDHDVAFKFLPKCGSTSVLRMLYEVENGVPFDPKLGGKLHQWGRKKKFSPTSNISRRIVIIRDPVKRFLSAYTNRVNAKQQLSKAFVKKNNPHVFSEIPYFNPTIEQFIDDFEIYRKVHQIGHHTKPICDFLKPWSLDCFTDVIPMEQISMIEDVISDIYNCEAVLGHHQVTKDEKKICLSDISESHLYKIMGFYSEDYKYLSDYYTEDNIIHEWMAGNK